MFVAGFCLEALDGLSSAFPGRGQTETNRLLRPAAESSTLPLALIVAKSLGVVLLLVMFFAWRSSRREHDKEFVVCMSLVLIPYAAVVANNFLSR